MQQRTSGHRFMMWLIVICAWAGIVLQLVTNVPLWMQNGKPLSESLVKFFSYFTILTNLLVAVTTTFALFLPYSNIGRLCNKPGTITAITVYIVVVGLVYNVVLRPLYHPQGWAKVADELVHSVVPVLYLFYWLLFATKGNIKWSSAFQWLFYPLLYLIYTFFHGWVTHYYPYPFLDVTNIGYTGFWLNSFYMTLLFVGLNVIMIAIDKAIAKKKLSS